MELPRSQITAREEKGETFVRDVARRRWPRPEDSPVQPQPAKARTAWRWVRAVVSVKDGGTLEPSAAIETIRATPRTRRAEVAPEIWEPLQQHDTDSAVPC
jgi:hypothetical protein